MQDKKCLPNDRNKAIKFSDGVLMGSWISTNKPKLEEMSKDNEKAKAIVNELNRRKGLSFEEKLEETYEYLQENRCLPSKMNKTIKFSDGTLIGSWISTNKSKLEEMSKDNEKVKALVNELNRRKGLSFEERLEETYEYLQKHESLPSFGDNKIKFSDETIMWHWLNNQKNEIEEMGQNNEKARVIINELNSRKGLSFEGKLEEAYNYLQKNGSLPSQDYKTIKFSDGVLMGSWVGLNRNKLKLAEMSKDNEQARELLYYLDNKNDFAFQKKINEAYNYLQEYGILPSKNTSEVYFSDGKVMNTWIYDKINRSKLENISGDNEKARIILYYVEHRTEILFQKKLNEIYEYVTKTGDVPTQKNKNICFNIDNKPMGKWFDRNKQKIHELYLSGDEFAVKFVNAVLEIKPKYFDRVKKVIEAKEEFEKGKKSKKEVINGRSIQ